jgi:hypothetical protein
MKALALAALLITSTAYAQTSTPVPASTTASGTALQVVAPRDAPSRLDVEIGAATLTTHSGRYTFAYLPLLAPLPGTAFRSSMEIPNALALTGTSIPQRPRTRLRGLMNIR